MNLKEELKKIRNGLSEKFNDDLETKVDDFIDWYYKNMVKGKYTEYGEYSVPRELRNFIEKMAVWYELRYPDYEINRLMYCCGQEGTKVSEEMFINNQYIKDFIDNSNEVKYLDWNEFYNTNAFINSLPWEEYKYLAKPKYATLVYIDPSNPAHFHLSTEGTVIESEGLSEYTSGKIKDADVLYKHIKDILSLLKKEKIDLPKDNEIEPAIKRYEKRVYFKEQLLDCVMYRIIERGGCRIGPRRAFLFAKEFGRNIDVPMKYAVDRSDPGLREFINEYIKAGGSKDLVCYENYFIRISKHQIVSTITVQELLRTIHNNCVTKYTPEETELHQRMVNVLASQFDQEEVRKEKVKQLRLERKLQKSRNVEK